MPKKQDLTAEMQSRMDNMKDAKNASNGFKAGMSSGTNGAGDSYSRNKR